MPLTCGLGVLERDLLLLEARPHVDRQRELVWAEAEQALARLPDAHPVRRTLQRDLAYLQLTHARHVTEPGVCADSSTDFATCESMYTATKSLDAITETDTATPVDHELLARAYEFEGEVELAKRVRLLNGPVALDERTLGYLDFSAAEPIRCNLEATSWEIDREYAIGLQRDPEALLDGARLMPSIRGGQFRGIRLYGVRSGNKIRLLGFKNGDIFASMAVFVLAREPR